MLIIEANKDGRNYYTEGRGEGGGWFLFIL